VIRNFMQWKVTPSSVSCKDTGTRRRFTTQFNDRPSP
jgi:hypothetical protein